MQCIVQVLIFGWLAGSATCLDLVRQPGSMKPSLGANNDEVDAKSVQGGGMARMQLAHIMKLALVLNVDDSNVNAALVNAISKIVDAMWNSELLAAAHALGVGRHELDLTADVEDHRAAVIELIAKASQNLPDGTSGDQGGDSVEFDREPKRSDTVEAVVTSDGRIAASDSNAELHHEHPVRPPSLLHSLQDEDFFAGGRRRRRRRKESDSRRREDSRRRGSSSSGSCEKQACKKCEDCLEDLKRKGSCKAAWKAGGCLDPGKMVYGSGWSKTRCSDDMEKCGKYVDKSCYNKLVCQCPQICKESKWYKNNCGSNLMERMNRSSNHGEEDKSLNELSRTALDHSLQSKCT